ncbi:MAG: AraC family transcriptional regulator [Verrucomicrobiales bacterium]|nr:AraC family transcriptional regulator [Verrucomicrobiales bacterium]
MPRVEKLSEHVHKYHQWLLYLRGQGMQIVEEAPLLVRRGTVVAVKQGQPHRFINESEVRPVCLVIDFEAGEPAHSSRGAFMQNESLLKIEQILVLLNAEDRNEQGSPVVRASLILQILALIEASFVDGKNTPPVGPVEAKVGRSIERVGLIDSSPRKIAEALGCSLDHLNRQLKRDCGKSLGDLISGERLKEAGRLLKETNLSMGEVGACVGMDDQNYFSRWFRKHSGSTPTQWRELR